MKTIRKYNHYINGADSKVNVYFEDGTQWHRTINSREVAELVRGGEKYLTEVLMEKYKEPQPERSCYCSAR